MDAVAVVWSEDGGEAQLQVAGVAEGGDHVGEAQLPLLAAHGAVARPLQVAGEAALVH